MGKMMSVVLGAAAAVVGFILLIKWWGFFLIGLKAIVPAMFIFGGIIALIAGLSEIKDSAVSKKEEKK